MSIPKGSEVDAQAQSAGIGGSTAVPSSVPAPCPSGDVPREGSRDIQQKGKIILVPHDWCKSTDSPVPYRIWAWQSSASNLANTVRQTDCRSHVLGSIVNQCYGDEPGTGGGVKSGTNLAECTPLSASPTVRAEGKPMVRYLDKWWMNHKNTWGCLNNSEDMGKYDAPKVRDIDRLMVAQATTVAPSVPVPVAPEMPSVPEAPIGPAAGLAAVGAGAAGLGIAVGGGLNAQQRLTEGANGATPGNTMPTWTGPLDLSASAPPTVDQIDKAYAKNQAQALAKAQVKPNTWVRITQNPCAALACGIPGSKYRGGTYFCTKGGMTQSHHTPAQSVSYLPAGAGPAIQMDPADHAQTLSYGNSLASATYRSAQSGLISSGNFMGAIAMDVADVKGHFGSKYDSGIAQMLAYAECLKKNGFVR